MEWVGEEGVVVGRVGLEAQFSEVGLDIVDGVQRGFGAGEVGVLSEGPQVGGDGGVGGRGEKITAEAGGSLGI